MNKKLEIAKQSFLIILGRKWDDRFINGAQYADWEFQEIKSKKLSLVAKRYIYIDVRPKDDKSSSIAKSI